MPSKCSAKSKVWNFVNRCEQYTSRFRNRADAGAGSRTHRSDQWLSEDVS